MLHARPPWSEIAPLVIGYSVMHRYGKGAGLAAGVTYYYQGWRIWNPTDSNVIMAYGPHWAIAAGTYWMLVHSQ